MATRRQARRKGSAPSRARNGARPQFQPQELAITLLGAYVRPQPRRLWSGGLVELLREFGFSTGAGRVALSRLVRRGLLERVREGRLVHYELTPRSEQLLSEGDRRIFSLGWEIDWDGTWTVLWHSIPEERRVDRSRLGRRLRFLGFGPVQDGTWISPHNRESEVLDVVADLDIVAHVGVILGRPVPALHIDDLIRRAWDLDDLERRYQEFVHEFSPHRGARGRSRLDEREAFLVRTRLVHAFRQFPFLDPDLPDQLMPGHRWRRQAAELFHDVYDGLGEPSQRYFNRRTEKSSVPTDREAGAAVVDS